MSRIIEMFGEPITYGGQESVVYNMLSSFDYSKGFNIDLFTPYYVDNKNIIEFMKNTPISNLTNDLKNKNSDNGKMKGEKKIGNIYNLNLKFKTGDNRFLLYIPVKEFIKKHHNYDVAHIHSGSLTTMFVYAKILKKYGIKKVIVHAHTTGHTNSFIYKIRRFILCYFLNKYVDIYLGCSEDALKSKFNLIPSKNVLVVNNGIDIDKFKYDNKCEVRNKIRKEYGIKDKFVIGSLGRIAYPKNNNFMIDIFVDFINFIRIDEVKETKTLNSSITSDNFDFVLMMVGDGEDLNEVKKYAKGKGVYEYIIFTGGRENPSDYYQVFDAYIMPSIYEGMPVTAIEAQASGLPCLLSENITKNCNISETTCFLSISNTKVWVDRLIEIKQWVNCGYVRGKQGIDFGKFDRAKTFKIVEDIYNNK